MRAAGKAVVGTILASAVASPFTEPLNWWIGQYLDKHPDAMSSALSKTWLMVADAIAYIPSGLLPGFAIGAGFAFLTLRGWRDGGGRLAVGKRPAYANGLTGASTDLRELANEYARAKIFFVETKNKVIASRISELFKASGWVTDFVSVPLDTLLADRIDGVEVRGYNRGLVDRVHAILSESGLTQTVAVVGAHKDRRESPKWQGMQNFIGVTVGYKEPPIT